MTMTNDSPTATETEFTDGRVVGIAGPVIDVEFKRGRPKLNTALQFNVRSTASRHRAGRGRPQLGESAWSHLHEAHRWAHTRHPGP